MSAIGPGDWVECVDAKPAPGFSATAVRVGAIYRVKGMAEHPLWGALVELSGVQPSAVGGYLVRRFRPIYRPKADLIESLKTPAKREGVPA